MFHASNSLINSKYYDNSNKSIAGKMKDETGSFANKEFLGLKRKMYSLLVDDSSEDKKAKDVNKNVVDKITHNEYKDVLFIPKCLRRSMNIIQSKNHRLGTYEISKVSFSLGLMIKNIF